MAQEEMVIFQCSPTARTRSDRSVNDVHAWLI